MIQEKFDAWWPDSLRILARATPADKRAFVRAVMTSGETAGGQEVVAVTASAVEDKTTLLAADVGIAMVRVLFRLTLYRVAERLFKVTQLS